MARIGLVIMDGGADNGAFSGIRFGRFRLCMIAIWAAFRREEKRELPSLGLCSRNRLQYAYNTIYEGTALLYKYN